MSDYESKSDALTHKQVHEHVKIHDQYMRENRQHWALAKAAYMTKYWDHVRTGTSPTGSSGGMSQMTDIDVEVNRLWGVISSYLSALYPRAARAVLSQDVMGQGDATKAELTVNRCLSMRRIHQRVVSALRQSLLYPGSGIKIGYEPGHGNPMDRVWMRVIPWWEIMLDRDVRDVEDERYRGHLYYRPIHEVEQEYGLEDLNGTSRVDFLAQKSQMGSKTTKNTNAAPSDTQAFVRVLELCNLDDHVRDEDNPEIVYKGRLEIYILGQGELSKKPVWIGPLPFATTSGQPMAHVVPLIFNHEPEFPLRGISHARRMMPQLRELNGYRSFMAMATRKDTRQYITRKGTFSSDELTNLTEGHDGLVLEVEQGFERPLGDAIIPIQNSPISSNIDRYLSQVERDLQIAIGTSPASRGQVTKATAFEVQTVAQYTESEYGLHASIRDEWLAGVVKLLLRAIIGAMQDVGDSAGAYEGQDVHLSEVGAKPDTKQVEDGPDGEDKLTEAEEEAKTEHIETESEHSEVNKIMGALSSYIDDDGVSELGKFEDADGEVSIEQVTLKLVDRREPIEVSVEDLDAEFEINFVEGGRTPLNDAAMQQNLMALLQPLTALWQAAQEDGPIGTFAKSYMKVVAERFDLPQDLHPEELETRGKEDAEKAESEVKEAGPEQMPAEAGPPGPPGAPPQGGAPQGGAPEGGASPDLAQIASLPPEQAIPLLRQVFANDPEMLATIDQLAQLPPEQQAQMLANAVGGPPQMPGM